LRLLPALFGLLATVVLWAVLVASPGTRHNALREVLAAVSYTRNLTWWAHVPGTLLGHTWSLALEEQFYLVWPAVLALCLRPRRSSVRTAVVFVVAFAAIGWLRMARVVGPAGLFLGRPDALLVGAALALVRRDFPARWIGAVAKRHARLAVVGATVVLAAIATWNAGDDLFGVGFTVAALAAAALIYGLVVLDGEGASRPYAWTPAVSFGRVSYGFYLWHLPALRWTDDRLVGQSAVVRMTVGFTIAACATLVSYRFLEQPAMRLKRRFAPSPLVFGGAADRQTVAESESVPATKEFDD
jgi:peptidoglycan/LPS O-acetylase OafA/YrhL